MTHITAEVEALALVDIKPVADEPLGHLLHIHLPKRLSLGRVGRLIDQLEESMRVSRTECERLADSMRPVYRMIMSGLIRSSGGDTDEEGKKREERRGAHDG